MKRTKIKDRWQRGSWYKAIREELEERDCYKNRDRAWRLLIDEVYGNEPFNGDIFDAAIDHLCDIDGNGEPSLCYGDCRLECFTDEERQIHGNEVELRAFRKETIRLLNIVKNDLEYNRTLNMDELSKLYKLAELEKTGWEDLEDENYGTGA